MQEATIEQKIKEAQQMMSSTLTHLQDELKKIRAGKASPTMLNGIMVPYYGNPTPLNQVANITASDSKTLSIQPWEKTMIAPIEKSIFEANLGITPQNNGEAILITIPPVTEDRRKQLVKQAKSAGEDAKVSLRNVRREVMDFIKKEVKEGYPEDAGKRKEGEVDSMVKKQNDQIEKIIAAKEADIMTV